MNIAVTLSIILMPHALACQTTSPKDLRLTALGPESRVRNIPLLHLLDSLSIPADSVRFRVVKSERSFAVLAMGRVLKVYPCVLGEVPLGDKQMQGDRRTPEGIFTFRDKYPHRIWHKFVWVDYPNAESRRRFNERKRTGAIPANATIGGEIGIHGVPEGMDHWIAEGKDWTLGCIALRNADLDEIYPTIKPRVTVLEVLP